MKSYGDPFVRYSFSPAKRSDRIAHLEKPRQKNKRMEEMKKRTPGFPRPVSDDIAKNGK